MDTLLEIEIYVVALSLISLGYYSYAEYEIAMIDNNSTNPLLLKSHQII